MADTPDESATGNGANGSAPEQPESQPQEQAAPTVDPVEAAKAEAAKLKGVPPEIVGTPELQRLADALNANVDNLNRLLFSNRDYAVIGSRL